MSIEADVVSRLRGSTALVALVGDEVRTVRQDSTAAGVTCVLVSQVPARTFGHTLSWLRSRVQVTARAKSFATLMDIGAAMRQRMERWSTGTVADTLLDNEIDLTSDGERYTLIQDYMIHHTT